MSRNRNPMALAAFLAAPVFAASVAATPARAQIGFTEFLLTDPDLNSSPETDFWIASAAPADVDGDGDLDLLVAGYYVVYFESVEDRLTLYRNDGPVDESTWALTPVPVDASGMTFQAADLAWGDYDNDGDPDALVAGYDQTVLFRNDGGTLLRTSTALPGYLEDTAFSTLDLHSVSWTDYDNDGDLDILIPSVHSDFQYEPTKLLRNDGPGGGEAWMFTDVGADLPVAPNALGAWADLESDGDLDLLIGNVSPYEDNFLSVYRNEAGTMQLATTDLAWIRYGMADWGDVDDDGDLDIVYGGNMDRPDGFGETLVRILFGDGQGGYTPFDVVHEFQSPEEPWLDFNAVTWADYDSDGDMDLLVSGEWLGDGEIFGRSLVYANTGGTFAVGSTPLPAPIAGNAGGAFTWFDIDSDGDLDYFVAGAYYVPGGNGLVEARTQLFRNEAPGANAAPSSPSGLTSAPTADGAVLAWTPAWDDMTASTSLTYDLEITGAGGGIAAERALPEPGNVGTNTAWRLRGLPAGLYRWSVRALDSAFNASPVAQATFSVGTEPGARFCFGDGSGIACPCTNNGDAGNGCNNSIGTGGARLGAFGTASPDTVVLGTTGEMPTALTLFVQGDIAIAPVNFGDALRCVDGNLKRLYVKSASGGAAAAPGAGDLTVTERSAALGDPISPGETRYYFAYYRDPNPGFCPMPTGSTFNASNAVSILW